MKQPLPVCIYCGQPGKMSKQHVFPDRLRHVLPRNEGYRHYFDEHRDIYRITNGSVGSSKIRKVCKQCNEGWLNEMELDCLPVLEQLILGQSQVIPPEHQIKLARSATSIAMIGEFLERNILTSAQERLHFRDRLEPPPGRYVFVGKSCRGIYYDDTALIRAGSHFRGLAPDKGPLDLKKNFFDSFTIILGPVLLHVLVAPHELQFHRDVYASRLGLAGIYPEGRPVYFGLMNALPAEGIWRLKTYARETFRQVLNEKPFLPDHLRWSSIA